MFTVIKSQYFCQDAVDAKKAEPDRYIIEAWAMVSYFFYKSITLCTLVGYKCGLNKNRSNWLGIFFTIFAVIELDVAKRIFFKKS